MINAILDFMDAANKADRKLGYELAIAQNISIEKILRAWLEKRFRFLQDLKNRGMCYFTPVNYGRGFQLKFNNETYEEYFEELRKYNIAHWHRSITLTGFFDKAIIFKMDKSTDHVKWVAAKHKNIKTLSDQHCPVKIPQYLF